jgi:hypothetical protein
MGIGRSYVCQCVYALMLDVLMTDYMHAHGSSACESSRG